MANKFRLTENFREITDCAAVLNLHSYIEHFVQYNTVRITGACAFCGNQLFVDVTEQFIEDSRDMSMLVNLIIDKFNRIACCNSREERGSKFLGIPLEVFSMPVKNTQRVIRAKKND